MDDPHVRNLARDLAGFGLKRAGTSTRSLEPGRSGRADSWRSLDGLRALAVGGVVLAHAHGRVGRGGRLGVQVFFVLSGFLITLILCREHEATGKIDLGRFYLRRVLRLLPGLLLLVLVVGGLALVGINTGVSGTLRNGVPLSLLYVSNWASAIGAGSQGLLAHTWSLAIEEQFYIVWPMLLIVLLRCGARPRWLLFLTLGGAATSALVTAGVWFSHPTSQTGNRLYYGTDAQAQFLLLGCTAAFFFLLARERAFAIDWLTPASVAALAGIGIAMVVGLGANATYGGGQTLVGFGTALLILGLVLAPQARIEQALGWTPLVALGRISYGIYLWNWPVSSWVAYSMRGSSGLMQLGPKVALTLTAAALSYFLVEVRFLRLKARLSEPSVEV